MFASHINWNWNLYVSRNYVGRYHKKGEVFIILRNQNTLGLDKKISFSQFRVYGYL